MGSKKNTKKQTDGCRMTDEKSERMLLFAFWFYLINKSTENNLSMHTSTFCEKVTLIMALCCDMCQLCILSNAINPSQKNMSTAFWMQLAPSNLFNFHYSKGTNLLNRERNFQFRRNHIKSLLQQHQTQPPEITEHMIATP